MNVGSGIYIGLVYHTVCGNGHPKTGFRERMYKRSVENAQALLNKLWRGVLT